MIPQHYIELLQVQMIELSRASEGAISPLHKTGSSDQQIRNARAALRRTLEKVEPFMGKQMALVSRALKSAAYAYDDILDPA